MFNNLKNRMLADFYHPRRSNDMKKNNLVVKFGTEFFNTIL